MKVGPAKMIATKASPPNQIADNIPTLIQPVPSQDDDTSPSALLITTQGRYSEQPEVSCLRYIKCNDDYLVIAKNDVDTTKPDWYLNLREEPIIQVEIGEFRFYAKAETVTGAERLRLSHQVLLLDDNPTRTIPRDTAVVLLKPLF